MQKIKEFEKYYVKNLRYNVFTSKHPESNIKELFEGVSKENIDLIIDTIIYKEIGFVNSSSFCFDVNFNKGNLKFNLKKNMNKESIFHEFGHAIDFIRLEKISNYKYVIHNHSKDTILSNGLTLDSTFNKEFKIKYKELYNLFFNKYKLILSKYLDDDNKDIVNTVINTVHEINILKDKIGSTNYNKLKKCYGTQYDNNLLNKYNLDSKFLDNHFERVIIIEDYEKIKPYYKFKKQVEVADELKEFNNSYTIILDALGSKYDVRYFWDCHTQGYFKIKGKMGEELFAHAFSYVVLNKIEYLDIFKEYFPESYNAFNELMTYFFKQKDAFCSLKVS